MTSTESSMSSAMADTLIALSSELVGLAALQGEAGRYDSLADYLEVAADTARRAAGAEEGFILYLGDAPQLWMATNPGSPFTHVVDELWRQRPPQTLGGPLELGQFLDDVKQALASREADSTLVADIVSSDVTVGLVGLLLPREATGVGPMEKLIGHILSVAIENFRTHAEARRHLARQSFLRETDRIFSAKGGLGVKIRDFLTRIYLLRGVDACAIVLCDPTSGESRTAASFHLNAATEPLVSTVMPMVAARSGPLYVADLGQIVPSPFGCYLGIPLLVRETTIGVLHLFGRQGGDYNRDDIEFFSSISEHIALNIDDAFLQEQTLQQLEDLSFVLRVSTALREEKTLTGMLRVVTEQCARVVAGDKAAFLTYDPAHAWLCPTATGDVFIERPMSVRTASHDYVEQLQKVRYSERPEEEYPELFKSCGWQPQGLARLLMLPLSIDQRLLGVALIGHRAPGSVRDRERRLLLTLTNLAHHALARAIADEEMQHREREEAASRAKSEFLAIMSHELRTPLTVILGFSEMLVEAPGADLNDKQREYVDYIIGNANHLLHLISDVLDLAKVESGKLDLTPEPFDLIELLEEITQGFGPIVTRKNVKLDLDIGDGVTRPMDADRRRVKQILYNLVSNAVKFTDGGGTVRLRCTSAGDASVRFEITDTGIGIAPHELESIFQPFKRGTRPPGRTYEGTGLGLSLTRKLVELGGGHMEVSSVQGQGSTFHVVMPRAFQGEPPS